MCYRTAARTIAFLFLITGAFRIAQAQAPTPTPETAIGADVKRWFDIDSFNLVTRYRYIRINVGVVTNNQQQWQLNFRPRIKFDRKGRYSVAAVIATGNSFTGGFNNTGWGTGDGQTNLFVKQLFFDAKPTKKVELQFGGLGVNLGENSEITAYDVDAYITGERIIVRHPKALYFDEISATNAYLGDLNRPSIFGRLHRLNESNYHQFLVRKQATKMVSFSGEYTFQSGLDFFREGVRIKPHNFFFTTLLADSYQRVSSPNGFGIDLFAEKVIDKHFTANGGFARLDDHLTLNADRFPPGKRVYASLIYRPVPEFSIQPFIIQVVGHLPTPSTPRTRFDFLFSYNVLESLHRHHIF